MNKKQLTGFLLGFVLFFFFLFGGELKEGAPRLNQMAAIASLMAVFWITEVIPLAATSLIPLVMYPLLGLVDGDKTAASYINSTIFLFLGGFIIALAMEKWNLHKRIALKIILITGNSPDRIILGFLLASAFISMWISNTATAMMMLPVGLAVITQIEEQAGKENVKNFSLGVLLVIAYGCSIGGIMTLIGTAPNLSFIQKMNLLFPSAPQITFGQWMQAIVPVGTLLLLIVWLLITKVLYRNKSGHGVQIKVIESEYRSLGKAKYEEKVIGAVFLATAVLWIFRSELNLGFAVIPGWSRLLPASPFVNDGTVAVFSAIILFLVPAKNKTGGNNMLINSEVFPKIPWEIILLFGGGFALARGFVDSGLSKFIGDQFAAMDVSNPFIMILTVAVIITFLTELTSNTATAEMILPVLAAVSVAMGINPMLLMITATISVSMAFMLPVATPPNAIIFGSGRIHVYQMAKTGVILNLIGAVVISVAVYYIVTAVFNIDLTVMPGWAKS